MAVASATAFFLFCKGENMEKQEVVFRRKRVSFSQISNTLIDDLCISNNAKMLYIIINRWIDAPNYKIYKGSLQKQMQIGSKNTFDKYWSELKEKGYLVQYKMQDEKGMYYYEYELMDIPDVKELKKDTHTPKNEVREKGNIHTPIIEALDDRGTGKLGSIHYTKELNTNLLYTDRKKTKNKFNDFPQRNYTSSDLKELEKRKLQQ